jgi:hypothetical protein
MAVPGSVVGVGKLITPGGQQGPKGDAGTAANVPLADITQNGLLRQNTGKTTDFVDGTNNCQPLAPQIWSVRLRSFNSVGNPNFEVDQRMAGASLINPVSGSFPLDRWAAFNSATMAMSFTGVGPQNPGVVPGTNFRISYKQLTGGLTVQQVTLGANDYYGLIQHVEGCVFRELINDVSSVSLLVYSSVANLKFSVSIRDNPATKSLVKLCSIPTANTWTLINLPNLPVFPSGNFSMLPGVPGYDLAIILAAGTSFIAPAADTWQTGNFLGAPGMSNFGAQSVNSTFILGFVQHEPGPLCSTLIDKPFSQNLDECLRYYQKTYLYSTKPGTPGNVGCRGLWQPTANAQFFGPISFVKVMAKVPTVVLYDIAVGTPNTYTYNGGGTGTGVTAVSGMGDAGYSGFASAGAPAAGSYGQWHHTADTGW